ncbi:MAG: GTP cyclohydrolase II [Acetobacteraceae bacterium]|nr:GTP cyclohydrolase II [Acetobacteraceae bacterium]
MTSPRARIASLPPEPPEPPVIVSRLRRVHRAASDFRRGVPVLLLGDEPLLLLAAETAGVEALGEFTRLATQPPVLLLAATRAAAVLHRPVGHVSEAVALRLAPVMLEPGFLRALSDPLLDQTAAERMPELEAAPPNANAALTLAKLGRLLPAVLAATVAQDIKEQMQRLQLLSVSAAEVLTYPATASADLRRIATARVPLEDAPDAQVVAFRTEAAGIEHLAIIIGEPDKAAAPLVRLHSECFTGDLLGSLRCDCGQQLRGAIRRMAEEGAGVLLYLAQEGRGIGLVNKLRAYALQDHGLDTLDANRALGWGADERNFLIAATMLSALGLRRIRLLTNNPDKLAALVACGVEVVGREAHAFAPNGVNDEYLATKAARFGHLLD